MSDELKELIKELDEFSKTLEHKATDEDRERTQKELEAI